MTDLDEYHRLFGFFRASGLSDSQAHYRAEEAMMTPNEWNMQNILADALEAYAGTNVKIRTYEDAGMLTRDKGLIVEVEGSRFQLTIVKA
ncbi:MAG: hypothetical protein KF747_03455 [Nitrospira sp.]|nr:hypothetical protein [Nitrospira sp.]